MFTRRALAAFAGLTTGAAGLAASAQTPAWAPVRGEGTRCYIELEGARIDPDIVSLRTAGDTVVGVGAATFSTRLTRSPFARRFTAADGRVFEMQAELDGWSLAAFGMLPNTAADRAQSARNREAHQRAVDHALWLMRNGNGTHRLVFHPGTYFVDGAIKVFHHNVEDGTFDYSSVEISAPARGYAYGQNTSIRNTNNDQPCYAVQSARQIKFSNFSIQGATDNYTPSLAELVGAPTWSNSGGMGTKAWAPACAVVVDPFSNNMAEANRYPGLMQYYTYSSRGSSATVFENMEFKGFPVGICLSPSLETQNNDSVMIRDCDISYNTIAIAVCQSQNRAVRIENCRIHASHIMIDTQSYGNGNGAMPLVKDCNITYIKYLVNSTSGVSRAKLINCDVESTFSIGYWGSGGMPLDIEGCQIKLVPTVNLYPPAYGGSGVQQANIDYQLYNIGPVNFIGGYVGFYSNVVAPLSIEGSGRVCFNGCATDMPPFGSNTSNTNPYRFDNTILRGMNAGARFGADEAFATSTEGLLANQVDAKMPHGGTAQFGGVSDYSRWRNVGGTNYVTLNSAVTITATGDGLATFTASNPERFMVGEWLSSLETFNSKLPDETTVVALRYVSMGQVRSVVGSTVTLQCVPIGFTTGSYSVVAQWLPSYRRRCYGKATSGSPILTSIPIKDHGFNIGDRLLASGGIPTGAYVTAVDTVNGTITMNTNATSSAVSRVRTGSLQLEDAPRSAEPTAGVTYIGDFYRNAAPLRDERGRIITGWLALTDGNPGVMAPQYAGGPAAAQGNER